MTKKNKYFNKIIFAVAIFLFAATLYTNIEQTHRIIITFFSFLFGCSLVLCLLVSIGKAQTDEHIKKIEKLEQDQQDIINYYK